MAIKIAIATEKGGVGKTTSALSIADGLRRKKKKVLLIDGDPQMNCTRFYGAKVEEESTMADIIYNGAKAKETIQKCDHGDIIPNDEALKNAEFELRKNVGKEELFLLKEACREIEDDYDYIICDCPRGSGLLLNNVLTYVDYVIIPLTLEKFGLEGLAGFMDQIKLFARSINPELKILGIAVTRYQGTRSIVKDYEEKTLPKIRKRNKIFKTYIRECIKVQEAQGFGESIFDYSPRCNAALDYKALTEEIIAEIKKDQKERGNN